MPNPHLAKLIQAGQELKMCELRYRKSVASDAELRRVIEPYSLSTGKQDILVRCFQHEPEDGWRTFMVHKIQDVRLLDIQYSPRRKVSIADAEVEEKYTPSPYWTAEREAYRDIVCDMLADGEATSDELEFTNSFIHNHNLSQDDIRFVHASLYHRCLGAILEDGIISEDEAAEIRFLHRVFNRLGWSLGE